MEVVTQKVRESLPWELLYADDLVLVAQSIEELREKGSTVEGLHGVKRPKNEYR